MTFKVLKKLAPGRLFSGTSMTLLLSYTLFSPVEAAIATLRIPEIPVTSARLAQRNDYQRAIAALKQGDINEFNARKSSLSDYPLYPFLEFNALSYRLGANELTPATSTEIKNFLTAHPHLPVAAQLRDQWRRRLLSTQQWRAFLKETPRPTDAAGLCDYHYAQLQVGNRERAWSGAKQLWMIGGSQAANCDDLFAAWRASSDFQPSFNWTRTLLALQAGQINFAQHMSKQLTPSQKNLVNLWESVHQKVSN